jgi:hypothetical protein
VEVPVKRLVPCIVFGALLFAVHALGFNLFWSVAVMTVNGLAIGLIYFSANLPTTRKVGASA